MFRDSTIPRVLPRPDHEIRWAACWWAWDALKRYPGDYGMVEMVLAALGLDRPGLEQLREREEPCWPYGGTSRGLNIHFKSYTNPCEPCRIVRDARRGATARALGITHEGTVA